MNIHLQSARLSLLRLFKIRSCCYIGNICYRFWQDQISLPVSMEEISIAPENGISDLPQATISPEIKSCRSLKAGEKAQPEVIKLWKENGFTRYLKLLNIR